MNVKQIVYTEKKFFFITQIVFFDDTKDIKNVS